MRIKRNYYRKNALQGIEIIKGLPGFKAEQLKGDLDALDQMN